MKEQKRRPMTPKEIWWYLGSTGSARSRTDLQGLVRRLMRFFRQKWDRIRQSLRYMGREKRALRFPSPIAGWRSWCCLFGEYFPVCQPVPGAAVPLAPPAHTLRQPAQSSV